MTNQERWQNNCLIAEKVMGWTEIAQDRHATYGLKWYGRNPKAKSARGEAMQMAVPDYSTDIAAAWEVEKKMLADGWVSRHSATLESTEWIYDQWSHAKGAKVGGQALAKETPEAICLAALKVVGTPLALSPEHEEP